ncbi:efflux RND transporter periplasmic adaptor subunit [Geomesophilobacter sediminis]|uniref:Efflux RND transporter periplasmic adaptor subunit n=1 Tax=Geomesophilobacter sediminis TaxID=2798584 RepID=A0A8J7J7T0_9BACT|nr:efflux RND transporter periplasmic adaptor subunit [Geomesophilobacter sediminis]MBJ6725456.1 efflux RND transporter periplasmic adaptor subunit [Geomesophilobacter sediminis]
MKRPGTKIILPALLLIAGALGMVGINRTPARAKPDPGTAKAVLCVATTLPERKQWPQELPASGSIVAWQEAVIGAETGGLRITALHADVGSRVRRGQLLAELARDSVQAELRKYQASLASAQASLAQAKANADRARQVRGSGAISEQQVHDYLAAEKTAQANVDLAEAQIAMQRVTLSQTRIVAVDDGIITSRSAVLGQVVASGTELFRMQRQGRLEWQAEVDTRELAQVKEGAEAEVTLPSGELLHGKVRLAAPTLSPTTSRANVLVTLPAGSGAKAGMFASGLIRAGVTGVVAVPDTALVMRDGRSYLFEVGAGNKVTRRTVTAGMHRDGQVQVGGIDVHARIVSSGGAFLSDGDVVRLAKE